VNNRIQNIWIKYNSNEELIINGIPDKKKQAKLMPIIEILENSNIILDFFSNRLISSLLISPILFGETKPEIISNGLRYDGLSFL
jgi:hypothetical protein